MKVENVRVTMDVPEPGEHFTPDAMSQSSLLVGGEWLHEFVWPPFAHGDEFGIRIPSGEFRGVVDQVFPHHGIIRVGATGSWRGQYAGLANGNCAFGQFEYAVPDSEPVITSVAPPPIRWDEYLGARFIAQAVQAQALAANHTLAPEEQRDEMRLALAHLRERTLALVGNANGEEQSDDR